MKNSNRKRLFVDYQVQGGILGRIAFYWFICLAFMTLAILLVQTLSTPDQPLWVHLKPMFERYWPVYAAMIFIVPFVCYDALKLSNRFCGPLARVVEEVDEFNRSGKFSSFIFREDDFWKPLGNAVSALVERVRKSESGT